PAVAARTRGGERSQRGRDCLRCQRSGAAFNHHRDFGVAISVHLLRAFSCETNRGATDNDFRAVLNPSYRAVHRVALIILFARDTKLGYKASGANNLCDFDSSRMGAWWNWQTRRT